MGKKKKPALRKRSEVKSGKKRSGKGKGVSTSKGGKRKSGPSKRVTQKELLAELDQALLHEIELAKKRKQRALEKRREINELLRGLEDASGIKQPRIKKDGKATKVKEPQKRKLNPALVKRNAVARMLHRHLAEKSLDLIVYGIVDKATGEIVYPENGDISTKAGRFNQVLKNILEANKESDIATIDYSFDIIFQQDAGLAAKQSLHIEEDFRFFDATNEFMRPVYEAFKIKISVSIPFSIGGEYYTGADDPKLPEYDAQKDCHFGYFTSAELVSWIPFSHAYRLCRDWDKQNGSEYGIVEFKLEERTGDEYLWYHVTMYENFFSRYEVKKGKLREPPGLPLAAANEKREKILEEIRILQSALPFLTGDDRKALMRGIEEKSIEQTVVEREIKQLMSGPRAELPPAATEESIALEKQKVEIEKEKVDLERLKLESEDKRRQQELELAKINAETEKLKLENQAHRMDMMKQMLDKGFTYDQIKDLLGK